MHGAYKAVSVLALACSMGLSGVAAQAQGRLFMWGHNAQGQLGNGGNGIDSNVPVQVIGLTNVVDAAVNGGFTVACKSDGTVWTWGDNVSGDLGNGTTISSSVPLQVPGLTNVIAVAAGSGHGLALKADGTVWAWGNNQEGELGNGTTTDSYVPVQVPNLGLIVAIAANEDHSLALKADGTVWSWGANSGGDLGTGSDNNASTPQEVSGLNGVVAISAGVNHGMALKPDGTVWTWGHNEANQLGVSGIQQSYVPVQVVGLPVMKSIAAGMSFSLAMDNAGFIEGWGANVYGEMGNGTAQQISGITVVNGLSHPTQIAAGWEHGMALSFSGVSTWGKGDSGQLGNGSYVDSDVPVAVTGLPYVAKIAAGYDNSLAIEAIGTLPSKLTLSSTTCQKGRNASITATLKDGSTPLAGVAVQFAIDGVNVAAPATTDANGQAKFTISVTEAMAIGAHPCTVSFAGNAFYAPNTAHSTLTVTPGPVRVSAPTVSASAGSIVTLVATLKDLNGAPLPGESLTFTVAGTTITVAVTDGNGAVQLRGLVPAGTKKGTYPLVVSFAGDSDHLAGSGSGKITIK